ncbi:hypothetical protein FOZ62_006498, partial [Perkinsus olseni]
GYDSCAPLPMRLSNLSGVWLWSTNRRFPPLSRSYLASVRRKRVPGGVPYHLYKLVTYLKRRKAFNLKEATMVEVASHGVQHSDVLVAEQRDILQEMGPVV